MLTQSASQTALVAWFTLGKRLCKVHCGGKSCLASSHVISILTYMLAEMTSLCASDTVRLGRRALVRTIGQADWGSEGAEWTLKGQTGGWLACN